RPGERRGPPGSRAFVARGDRGLPQGVAARAFLPLTLAQRLDDRGYRTTLRQAGIVVDVVVDVVVVTLAPVMVVVVLVVVVVDGHGVVRGKQNRLTSSMSVVGTTLPLATTLSVRRPGLVLLLVGIPTMTGANDGAHIDWPLSTPSVNAG